MSQITHDIERVITCLKADEIAAIPTETVYGLAGNAESDAAVKKIFDLKKRPSNHPLILHIAKNWDVNQWAAKIPDYAYLLMEKFWPGPLTLVFASTGRISPLITGGQKTVAIRCPNHPVTEKLLNALNFPVVAPSANPFGKISPTTAQHVQDSFPDDELLIFDGGRCAVGIESTIIDATHSEHFTILRHGTLKEKALQKASKTDLITADSAIRVPGKLDNHYQPEKPLYCFNNLKDLNQFCQIHDNVYVLSFHKDEDFLFYEGYQMPDTPGYLAFELYYQLRLADQSAAKFLAIELPPNTPLWEGIRERILKASCKV